MRRIHVAKVGLGRIALSSKDVHHLVNVLRMLPGTQIQVFDSEGASGQGTLEADGAAVVVERIDPPRPVGCPLTIASAIPKGARADWLIEKLSEIGVEAFQPIISQRSVVDPKGQQKMQRWARIAEEAARQSRRIGVMRIEPPAGIAGVIAPDDWCLSLEAEATPIAAMLRRPPPESLTIFVGPEGGWTSEEIAAFGRTGVKPVRLTATTLRIETAAVLAAGIVAAATA